MIDRFKLYLAGRHHHHTTTKKQSAAAAALMTAYPLEFDLSGTSEQLNFGDLFVHKKILHQQ